VREGYDLSESYLPSSARHLSFFDHDVGGPQRKAEANATRRSGMESTLRAMDEELVTDSLVYPYNPSASPDGLRGSEGTFSMCSCWYVDALARSGRLDNARSAFEKMLTYTNHVGLFSEEIGPSGEQIGNFPQAFSHLALISAAINLDHQLDHGVGNVGGVIRP
jgi:GH15 family glucan-1,4-alpha-glucosidase